MDDLHFNTFQTDDQKQIVNQLLEMFPDACALEVTHCLSLMSGNVESTAQLIMQRQETGQSLKPNDRSKTGLKNHQPRVDDKSIKDRIMHKYGFVDQAVDSRYHRPTLKKEVIISFCQNLDHDFLRDFDSRYIDAFIIEKNFHSKINCKIIVPFMMLILTPLGQK